MTGTVIETSAEGDYDQNGPVSFSNGLNQIGHMPVDVSYFSLDIGTLSAAQVKAIEDGTAKVTLSFKGTGAGTLDHHVLITGQGLTAAADKKLTGGEDGSTAYTLLRDNADTLVRASIGPGSTTYSLRVTPEVKKALLAGDRYFVIGASESTGGPASLSNVRLDVTCYAAGTRLATPQGDRPVEALQPGDLVLTGTDRRARKVKWIGERTIDLLAHPQPALAAPIRIAAGAFADGVPARDLLISPDHCVHVDGRLIPARRLLNGTTVSQRLDLPRIQYFHVELDRHDLLCAEGLLAESYLDTGNRAVFSNAGTAMILHPDLSGAKAASWHEDACAPFASAEEARVVWQHLVDRAASRGWPPPARPQTTPDSAPRLRVGGRIVPPAVDGARLLFGLPRGVANTVQLTSRATPPAALRPWEDDRRALGLCVQALILHGAHGRRRIALDDPALGEGWWGIEAGPHGLQRWTDGHATLTLPRGEPVDMLEVVLHAGATHVHAAPARRAA